MLDSGPVLWTVGRGRERLVVVHLIRKVECWDALALAAVEVMNDIGALIAYRHVRIPLYEATPLLAAAQAILAGIMSFR